ncbi:hypothetical protein D918_04894 [Trichuris suis]|nr:hypothetical protein D918_04894 [Trichuris suis]
MEADPPFLLPNYKSMDTNLKGVTLANLKAHTDYTKPQKRLKEQVRNQFLHLGSSVLFNRATNTTVLTRKGQLCLPGGGKSCRLHAMLLNNFVVYWTVVPVGLSYV